MKRMRGYRRKLEGAIKKEMTWEKRAEGTCFRNKGTERVCRVPVLSRNNAGKGLNRNLLSGLQRDQGMGEGLSDEKSLEGSPVHQAKLPHFLESSSPPSEK